MCAMCRRLEMPGQVFWKPFTISSKRSKRPPGSGVVAVAHTEGAGNREEGVVPHNHALLIKTLTA
jgi:hypothetical protein